MISGVEAAPLKENGHRVDHAACLTHALRADSRWFFIEPLSSLESGATKSALIFVNRQLAPLIKKRLMGEVAVFCLVTLALLGIEC